MPHDAEQIDTLGATSDIILKIKVARIHMSKFPFDLFYLVPKVRRDVLPKLFPYSLCLPPSKELTRHLTTLSVYISEHIPLSTRKTKKGSTGSYIFFNNVQLGGNYIEPNNYFLLVPILPRLRKNDATKNKLNPSYLVAPHYVHSHSPRREIKPDFSNFSALLTDASVMFTPKGPLQPVCLNCPRNLLRLQRKCTLGCRYCFEELILKRLPDDEQLHHNNTESNTNT